MIQRSVENSSSQTPGSPFSDSPSLHGWTLILPAGWSRAFFPSLIHTGTRVGGQRERQTQAFESSRLFFPRDYPSTAAYDTFADERGNEEQERWSKKPRAKRPSWEKLGVRSPWKPDWDAVLGLKNPRPFSEEVSTDVDDTEDLIPADRSEDQMQVDQQSETSKCRQWLLRGPGIAGLITSMVGPGSSDESRMDALLRFVDEARAKRNIFSIAAEASELYDPPPVSSGALFRGALVCVALRLVRRGCPSDMAIIYDMSDEEVFHHERSKGQDQANEPVDIDEENKVGFFSSCGLI